MDSKDVSIKVSNENNEKCCKEFLQIDEVAKRHESTQDNSSEVNKNGNSEPYHSYQDPDEPQHMTEVHKPITIRSNTKKMSIEMPTRNDQSDTSKTQQDNLQCNFFLHNLEQDLWEKELNKCITFEPKYIGKRSVIFDFDKFLPKKGEVESELIAYISRSCKYKKILRHPLMVAYIMRKSSTIKYVQITSFLLSYIFSLGVLLSLYIPFPHFFVVTNALIFGLLPSILALCVRFDAFENWLRVALSITMITTSFPSDTPAPLLLAILFLMGLQLLFIFSYIFYRVFVYAAILKIVVRHFTLLFICYFWIIIMFCLCFSVLPPQGTDVQSFGSSLLDLFSLIIGNDSKKYFDDQSTLGTLFHIFFIIMLPILFGNLLIGLTIGDINEIRSRAELVYLCNRIQYIHAIEVCHRDIPLLATFFPWLRLGQTSIFTGPKRRIEMKIIYEDIGDYSSCISSFYRNPIRSLFPEELIALFKGSFTTHFPRNAILALDNLCAKSFAEQGIKREFIIHDIDTINF